MGELGVESWELGVGESSVGSWELGVGGEGRKFAVLNFTFFYGLLFCSLSFYILRFPTIPERRHLQNE